MPASLKKNWGKAVILLGVIAYGLAIWWFVSVQPRWVNRVSHDLSLIGFSPDSKTLATISNNPMDGGLHSCGPIQLWDVASGRELASLLEDKRRASKPVFSADWKLLAFHEGESYPAGTIRVIDVAAGEELASLNVVEAPDFRSSFFCFHPDCRTLAFTTGEKGKICLKICDAISGRELQTLKDVDWPFAFSPDGTWVVTGDPFVWPSFRKKGVRFWDWRSGRLIATFSNYRGGAQWLHFSPDGSRLAVVCFDEKAKTSGLHQIKILDVARQEELAVFEESVGPRFLPDGRTLVARFYEPARREFSIKLWDMATWEERGNLPIGSGAEYSSWDVPKTAREGQTFVVGSGCQVEANSFFQWLDGTFGGNWGRTRHINDVRLVDGTTAREVATIRQENGGEVFLSPDGKSLAMEFSSATSGEEGIAMWDVPPRKPLGLLLVCWGLLLIPLVVLGRKWVTGRRRV